jgi:hypothetical protein
VGRKSVKTPEKTDAIVDAIKEALALYKKDHPKAKIDVYRYNQVSVRVRVIDPDLRGLDRIERDDLVRKYLDHLDDEVVVDITLLILLTPEEKKTSHANFDFENPIPWPIRWMW